MCCYQPHWRRTLVQCIIFHLFRPHGDFKGLLRLKGFFYQRFQVIHSINLIYLNHHSYNFNCHKSKGFYLLCCTFGIIKKNENQIYFFESKKAAAIMLK